MARRGLNSRLRELRGTDLSPPPARGPFVNESASQLECNEPEFVSDLQQLASQAWFANWVSQKLNDSADPTLTICLIVEALNRFDPRITVELIASFSEPRFQIPGDGYASTPSFLAEAMDGELDT